MIGLNYAFPIHNFLASPFTYIGLPLILAGLGLTVKVRRLFEQTDTEINTFKEPRRLVIKGPFKFSRNLIYLGFTIALLGIGLLLGKFPPY